MIKGAQNKNQKDRSKTDKLLERLHDLLIDVDEDPVTESLAEDKERYLFRLASLRAGIKELIKEFS